MEKFDKSPEQVIKDVLSRYSVTDLREQDVAALDRAAKLESKASNGIQVLEQGETNLIKWWRVRSGSKVYEVRRFQNFIFCSCLDFFFSKTACKHAYVTTNDFRHKQNREADNAPYLKNSDQRIEKVGKFRI